MEVCQIEKLKEAGAEIIVQEKLQVQQKIVLNFNYY